MLKNASSLLLFLLLANLLVCAFSIRTTFAFGDIYIRADGSIYPSTAPIQRNVSIYTFTGDISGDIIVQKDSIVINGASHTLQGTGDETGIDLSSRTNVTIQNMAITTFYDAVYLNSSNQITISGTNITDSTDGIRVSDSYNNTIYENIIEGNSYEGIYILSSSNNTISENNIIANTGDGVYLWGSSNNTAFGNDISNNWWGITSYYSSNNRFFHNSFLGNAQQGNVMESTDSWDNGYPSGGNYWNDYAGVDTKRGPNRNQLGSDGIGDTPYTIDADNLDNYPLMGNFSSFSSGISAISNSTISNFQNSIVSIAFDVAGQAGTTGFCTLAIPYSTKSPPPPYTVRIDGTPISYTTISDDNVEVAIYFTYTLSTHRITITYTPPAPQIPGGSRKCVY